MQIAQSKVLRLIYDHGVGVRHVQTVFHNRSAEKHVVVSPYEVHNLVFKCSGLHLTVRNADLHVRNQPVQNVMYGSKFLHFVVHEENLPSPFEFIFNYAFDFFFVEQDYLCLGRNPVWRRGADDGKVSGSEQRELEGSRNRSGREGERVHGSLHLSELFFGGHAEFLLFIHYEQA